MSNDADKGPLITWHHSLEDYFRETGEKANCLAWCHKRAEELYDGRKTFIDLPVIILSAITGFLSVGSEQIFQGWSYTPVVLGVSSLFVSVLNTTGSYFGWAKRQEGHPSVPSSIPASTDSSRLNWGCLVRSDKPPRLS